MPVLLSVMPTVMSAVMSAPNAAQPRSRQCQHLVQRRYERDEFELDELLACRAEFLGAQVQSLHQRGAAVVAQALRVGHRDQEQIQRCGACLATIDQVALHQGLINPAELLGHLAQPLRPQQSLDCLHRTPR